MPIHTEDPKPNPQTSLSFKVLLAALAFSFVALLTAIVNVLSQKQAPPNTPLEEKTPVEISR